MDSRAMPASGVVITRGCQATSIVALTVTTRRTIVISYIRSTVTIPGFNNESQHVSSKRVIAS
jgi:hypothetical protein